MNPSFTWTFPIFPCEQCSFCPLHHAPSHHLQFSPLGWGNYSFMNQVPMLPLPNFWHRESPAEQTFCQTLSRGSNFTQQTSPVNSVKLEVFEKETTVSNKEDLEDSVKQGEDCGPFDLITRAQVKEIVELVISSHSNQSDLAQFKHAQYLQDPKYSRLFQALVQKYKKSHKPPDDMKRYIIRKVLSLGRNRVRTAKNKTVKEADIILCQRYFDYDGEESENEDVRNYCLPYKKKSRNKTANQNCISELFASKSFNRDYEEFLKQIDEIFELQKEERVTKFVLHLLECLKMDRFESIETFKRLPWLKSWQEQTKRIAIELQKKHRIDSKSSETKGTRKRQRK